MAGANIKSKDNYVYFLYSEQQRAERTRIEKSMSRIFNPGVVVVNGKRENFTEISKNPTNRYPDCKVVAQGIKSKMVFTPISITK
jgi:hypothetical protein